MKVCLHVCACMSPLQPCVRACVCMCLLRVLVRHLCQRLKDKIHLECSFLQPRLCAWMGVCLLAGLVRHCCQRLKDKTHLADVYECVSLCVPLLCAQLTNLTPKAVLLLLCLPCHYNYKGHLTLKPHSLSPRLHMWPVFLLQLNDWMHLHRFLLTSSPIWNLVPVRSAQNEHIHTDVQAHTHTHAHI